MMSGCCLLTIPRRGESTPEYSCFSSGQLACTSTVHASCTTIVYVTSYHLLLQQLVLLRQLLLGRLQLVFDMLRNRTYRLAIIFHYLHLKLWYSDQRTHLSLHYKSPGCCSPTIPQRALVFSFIDGMNESHQCTIEWSSGEDRFYCTSTRTVLVLDWTLVLSRRCLEKLLMICG